MKEKLKRNRAILLKRKKGWSYRQIGKAHKLHEKTVWEIVQRLLGLSRKTS